MFLFHIMLYMGLIFPGIQPEKLEKTTYTVMFYNTENLFDISDDSETADEEYTPAGNLHWNYKRYDQKLNNLYKVITACGDWNPPDIIGLCEVENRKVLNELVYNTPLSAFDLGVIHFDSEDKRGIDVAMIYNRKTITVISSRSISIRRPDLKTRDILYVKAILNEDTCHFFVNHWPSRSSGQLETEEGRISAALVLKQNTDSLLMLNPKSGIIIMGDFNDEPSDLSIKEKLGALSDIKNPVAGRLYNLSAPPPKGPVGGTLKFQGEWNIFDQMIVSGNILRNGKHLRVSVDGYRIMDSYFLLEPDKSYTGFKPFRTYLGFIYKGGFSDHLPVTIKLIR